jgi:MFS family permease
METGAFREGYPPTEIGPHQERTRPTAVRLVVLGWLCLLATVAYIHRGCLAVPAELVQEELQLTRDELAQVMSAFFVGYMFLQLPAGWIGDRWGTRRTLLVLVLLWSAATGWMGLAGGMFGLVVCRIINGAAQAGLFSCCVKSIAHWFPESSRATANGMLASFMSVGAVIATALTGQLLRWLTWRELFLVLAAPGLILAFVFYWWFRDEPEAHAAVNAEELALIHGGNRPSSDTFAMPTTSVWSILLRPVMLLICAQQFFRAAGYIFYLTWFPTFLQKIHGVSVVDSGMLASLPLLGVCAGSGLGGILLDRIYRATGSKQRSRQSVALVSMVACALFIYLAYVSTDTFAVTTWLTISSFCAGLGGPAAYTVTIDLGGRHIATVFSTMNMSGNFGAFLLPLAVAKLVDYYSWNEALLLLVGLYVAAAACWALVNVEATPDSKTVKPEFPTNLEQSNELD